MQTNTLILSKGFTTQGADLIAEIEQRMRALTGTDSHPADILSAANAAHYHLNSGGRRMRARLALQAGHALDLPDTDSIALATGVELLHNASLVHDDLQDGDRMRRSHETVWSKYGENIAICTGDLLLSAAYAALAAFSIPHTVPRLIALFHQRTADLIHGQCSDLSIHAMARHNFAAYETIAIGKSGSLFSLPLELAFVGAGLDAWVPRAREAANSFALGYQILDDIEDVQKDSGPSADADCLNAVLTLRAEGHGADAIKMAQAISRRHLLNAASVADTLPNGAGQLLKELALGLITDL